jgi:hypothetical protein
MWRSLLLLVFVVAVPAAQGDQLDQSLTLSNMLPSDGFSSWALDGPIVTAQTFTAHLSGGLTGVSVLIVEPSNVAKPAADIQLNIYGTASGIPVGTPLFTTTLNLQGSAHTVGGAVVLLGLSDIIPIANVSVVSGQAYAVGIRAVNVIPHSWCELYQLGLFSSDGRDPYRDGALFLMSGNSWLPASTNPPGDAFFATYVNTSVTPTPEPSTFLLLGVTLVLRVFFRAMAQT